METFVRPVRAREPHHPHNVQGLTVPPTVTPVGASITPEGQITVTGTALWTPSLTDPTAGPDLEIVELASTGAFAQPNATVVVPGTSFTTYVPTMYAIEQFPGLPDDACLVQLTLQITDPATGTSQTAAVNVQLPAPQVTAPATQSSDGSQLTIGDSASSSDSGSDEADHLGPESEGLATWYSGDAAVVNAEIAAAFVGFVPPTQPATGLKWATLPATVSSALAALKTSGTPIQILSWHDDGAVVDVSGRDGGSVVLWRGLFPSSAQQLLAITPPPGTNEWTNAFLTSQLEQAFELVVTPLGVDRFWPFCPLSGALLRIPDGNGNPVENELTRGLAQGTISLDVEVTAKLTDGDFVPVNGFLGVPQLQATGPINQAVSGGRPQSSNGALSGWSTPYFVARPEFGHRESQMNDSYSRTAELEATVSGTVTLPTGPIPVGPVTIGPIQLPTSHGFALVPTLAAMFNDEGFHSHCMLVLSDTTYVTTTQVGPFRFESVAVGTLIDELNGVLTFVNGVRHLFGEVAWAVGAIDGWTDLTSGIDNADAITFSVGEQSDLENSVWIAHNWPIPDDDADDAFNSGALVGLPGAKLDMWGDSGFGGNHASWAIPQDDFFNGARVFDSNFKENSSHPDQTTTDDDDWDDCVSSIKISS